MHPAGAVLATDDFFEPHVREAGQGSAIAEGVLSIGADAAAQGIERTGALAYFQPGQFKVGAVPVLDVIRDAHG